MVTSYRCRRDLLVSGLEAIPGMNPFVPRGTFYTFVDITRFGKTSQQLALFLLQNARVAVAPGTAFGEHGEGFIRICFASSEDNIREGLRRIATALAGLDDELATQTS